MGGKGFFNYHPASGRGYGGSMKTNRVARQIARFRILIGWAAILAVIGLECWAATSCCHPLGGSGTAPGEAAEVGFSGIWGLGW